MFATSTTRTAGGSRLARSFNQRDLSRQPGDQLRPPPGGRRTGLLRIGRRNVGKSGPLSATVGCMFHARFEREEATYMIRDEGPGFDTSSLDRPIELEDLMRVGGRGMLLIRTFMDRCVATTKPATKSRWSNEAGIEPNSRPDQWRRGSRFSLALNQMTKLTIFPGTTMVLRIDFSREQSHDPVVGSSGCLYLLGRQHPPAPESWLEVFR